MENEPLDVDQFSDASPDEDRQAALIGKLKRVASLFYWIACLAGIASVFSILHLGGLNVFALGLPVIMAPVLQLLVQSYLAWLMISKLLWLISLLVIGNQVSRNRSWALWLGVSLYALDAVPLAFRGQWLAVIVHVVFLYLLARGFTIRRDLQELQSRAG